MKNLILFSFIVFLISAFTTSCNDDDDTTLPPPSVSTVEELTVVLQKVIEETEMPGFSLAVVKNGELTFQKSFGFANLAANVPYTNQTTQPIGSISKTFIGAAVVKAIEDGYFTLDTDINDLLPVELVNPKNPDAVITVKHLVTHTSGLLDNGPAYNLAYYILPGENMNESGAQLMIDLLGVQQREGNALEDLMAAYYLAEGELYAEDNFSNDQPGQVYNYSNLASSLVAYIIEHVTGQSFDQYVAENIFQPLGMTNTSYQVTANRATLYYNKSTALPLYANDSYPDGSVNTSNEDLTKYLLDMMKGVTGNSQTLFSTAGYEMLFGPLLPEGVVPEGLGKNQGVFWIRDNAKISHDGGDPGLAAFLEFFDDGQTGFLLLTNMDASTDENEEKFVAAVSPIFSALNSFLQSN